MSELLEPYQLIISTLLLLGMLVAFASDVIKPSGVAVIGAAACLLFGFVNQAEMLAAFSNPAVITIGAMLVLSQALVRTGTLEALAGQVIAIASSRPYVAIVVLLSVALVASAFLNSTPVVVIMIPLVAVLTRTIGMSTKSLMIPLSYIAILGGTCTLIGTSTNLLVNSIARQNGHEGFGIFDITPIGLCAAASGVLFLLFAGRWLLPTGADEGSSNDDNKPVNIITECRITDEYDELGKRYSELSLLKHRGVRLVRVRRQGERVDTRDESSVAQSGDLLVLRVTPEELATLRRQRGVQVGIGRHNTDASERKTVRFTVLNDAPITGHRIRQAQFLAQYPVIVEGVRRHRVLAGPDLSTLVVKSGDEIWINGASGDVDQVVSDAYFVPSVTPVAKPFLRDRAVFAIATLALVVISAATGLMPLVVAAVIGIGFLLVIHSLDTDDAWSSLNAEVLILIYAMLIVGTALQNTGVVDAAVGLIVPILEGLPAMAVILIVYLLTSVLTESITNNSVAVIMTPIAMALAESLSMPATQLLLAVMFAASASFATPIGYQTNTLVHIAGNYRFVEFLKVGIPMNLFVGVVTAAAIALMY